MEQLWDKLLIQQWVYIVNEELYEVKLMLDQWQMFIHPVQTNLD